MARRRVTTYLYTAELIPRELVSRVHVQNPNVGRDKVDPSTDPVITLTKRYMDMVQSKKYDLIRLGECYEKALFEYMLRRAQNTVEIMIKCYGDKHVD